MKSERLGVGHPIKPLTDMGRADARSAQIGGPAGISQCFQISAYSGEPFTSIRIRNLFSKRNCRAALGDEAVKSGPQMSLIGMALALSRARKRLTRTGAGPGVPIIAPSGEPEGERPSTESREEMGLGITAEIVGLHVNDAALVNVAGRDVTSLDEVAEPLRCIGVNLVVIRGHGGFSSLRVCSWPWADTAEQRLLWHPALSAAWASSCDQRLVCQALTGNAVDEAVQPVESVAHHVAVIQPEGKFIDVAAKVLGAGVVIDADQTALENREHGLDAVGRDAIADVFAVAVVHAFVVEEQSTHRLINRRFVGVVPFVAFGFLAI